MKQKRQNSILSIFIGKGGIMKNKKMALIVVGGLVLLLLGGLCSWVVASNQNVKQFPFLSDRANETFIPTLEEWQVLDFNATFNVEQYLTDKLIQTGCSARLQKNKLVIVVGTHTQPTWEVYLSNGRVSVSDREIRAAYTGGAEQVLKNIRHYFPEKESGLSDQEIEIQFFIHGSEVGVWRGGTFKLAGEE